MLRILARATLIVAAVTGLAGGSAEAAARTIRIGVLNDASGPYSDNAGEGSVVAAKMAAEDFMARESSIAVEVVSADHQNKADIGSGIARRWMDVDKLDAIVDVPNSAVALAVNEVVRGSKMAFIASSAASSDLTGKFCSPNTIQWTYDTWAVSHAIGDYLAKHGGTSWFFVASNNALGHSMVQDATTSITANGGRVVNVVNMPVNSADYSSSLLQADSSDANVIAFATAGGDTVSLIKQSAEFGMRHPGRTFAALLATINDIHAAGLANAKDLIISLPFYWSESEMTRAWTKRYEAHQPGHVPTAFQAGVYSSVRAYLNAAAAAGTNDGPTVIKTMKAKPIDDDLFGQVEIRADGRAIHNMYLFKIKAPEASKAPWDYFEQVGFLSGPEAFRPLDQGGCPMVELSK